MRRFTRKNWFVLALILVPFLSWFANDIGIHHSSEHGRILAKLAVFIIFFLSGLMFRRHIFFSTLSNFKLHFSIQSFCYILIPSTAYLLLSFFPALQILPLFSIGILILACMPTTISSCVVLTALAKGNESGALFNGVISNIAGIFICPFLVSFFLGVNSDGISLDPIPILQDLIFLVLLPLLLGNIALLYLGSGKLKVWNKKIRFLNSFIVLIIIYMIFFDTFNQMETLHLTFRQIFHLCVQLFVLYLALFLVSFALGLLLGFQEKDLKAFIFTAPQKTLALGMPLTMAILSSKFFNIGSPDNAMIIALPLAIYHHIQLLGAGIFLRFKKYIFPIFFVSSK